MSQKRQGRGQRGEAIGRPAAERVAGAHVQNGQPRVSGHAGVAEALVHSLNGIWREGHLHGVESRVGGTDAERRQQQRVKQNLPARDRLAGHHRQHGDADLGIVALHEQRERPEVRRRPEEDDGEHHPCGHRHLTGAVSYTHLTLPTIYPV